jgi:amyloid beta A4 protein
MMFFFFYFPPSEGPFQSDALLVPEGCLFDHIHNASRCWPFVRWNQTGATACQERNMQMRSFAMLLPCGISLFSGVEFVCCPKHFKGEILFIVIFFPIWRGFYVEAVA